MRREGEKVNDVKRGGETDEGKTRMLRTKMTGTMGKRVTGSDDARVTCRCGVDRCSFVEGSRNQCNDLS